MEAADTSAQVSSGAATPGIDRVIAQLESIVSDAINRGSRDGYFAALYLRVTREVRRRVLQGEFDDGPRMDRLDACFAQRYLDAYTSYHRGGEVSRSWRVAFDAAPRWRPLILQHLLLGMNAHINLDLGVAAFEVSDGAPLSELRADFERINAVLSSLTEEVQDRVAASAPLLRVLDFFGGRGDEMLADFSIQVARDGAFSFAEQLARVSAADRASVTGARDQLIADLGSAIERPGLLLSAATLPLRILEQGTPQEITRRLL
jgi:hypothetical protein